MLKNEGGHIFRERDAKKLIEIKNDFVPVEIRFIINNVNRRSKLVIDERDFWQINARWLVIFLIKIQPEFTEIGKVLSNIIISKVKPLIEKQP